MEPRSRIGSVRERGFTLAAVLVIMSVMLIFVTYTVPRQWSLVMQRDRERQTIYVMQQYAKACQAFSDKNKTYPVSMQQLLEARAPRFIRCPKDGCVDPLTGELDWYVIPQAQAKPPSNGPPPPGPPQTQTTTTSGPIGIPIKDYAGGPFVGIRPNKKGSSLILFNGADHYEEWNYTALDYIQERTNRLQAAQKLWQ